MKRYSVEQVIELGLRWAEQDAVTSPPSLQEFLRRIGELPAAPGTRVDSVLLQKSRELIHAPASGAYYTKDPGPVSHPASPLAEVRSAFWRQDRTEPDPATVRIWIWKLTGSRLIAVCDVVTSGLLTEGERVEFALDCDGDELPLLVFPPATLERGQFLLEATVSPEVAGKIERGAWAERPPFGFILRANFTEGQEGTAPQES